MELSLLINRFDVKGHLVVINPMGEGNVNDTYLAVCRNTFDEHQVVLQRIDAQRRVHGVIFHRKPPPKLRRSLPP